MTISMRRLCVSATAVALATLAAMPADALVINLIDQGGVTGSAAAAGFQAAAAYWESVITTNVTLNFGVQYSALPTGVIGSTSSTRYEIAAEDAIAALHDNASSALDQSLVLPTLSTATYNDPTFGTIRGISMVRNAAKSGSNGISTTAWQYDTSVTRDNARLIGTEANLKALGYSFDATALDASITFSSAFSFDFNPTNGITAGDMDFVGVAIHEMGHALGFVSGVDTYDQYAGAGPNAATGNAVNWNNQTAGTILDLFRYSSDPHNAAPGTGPALDWSIGTASYLSLDGGQTQLFGNAMMATGAYNGDGSQASHFKDTASGAGGCNGANQIGIMDPTFCYGEMGVVHAQDLAAMDAIGWTLDTNILAHPTYAESTAQWFSAFTAAPEPASWALFVGGFGMIGGAVRTRRRQGMPRAA